MVCLNLFLLLLGVVVVVVQSDWQSDEYIILTLKDERNATLFYKTNFNLKTPEFLARTKNPSEPLDKLYLGSNALYWSFKNSDEIGQLVLATKQHKFVSIPEVKEGVFAGLDSDNNLYFYLPTSRIFRVYNFDEPTVKLRELTGIKDLENVHIMSRDPCNKDRIYLIQCSPANSKTTGFVFDFKSDAIVGSHFDIVPSKCYGTWGITPNGEKSYVVEHAEKGSIFYESKRLGSFNKLYHEKRRKITCFAAGNKELFYSIERMNYLTKFVENGRGANKHRITALEVSKIIGTIITAVVVHQPPTESCWTPNVEE